LIGIKEVNNLNKLSDFNGFFFIKLYKFLGPALPEQ